MVVVPVFFLQPFSREEERRIRTALSTLCTVEKGQDWGNDYIYMGYLWPNDTANHSLEDLRDLFESCEPFSPAYISTKPGPYRLSNYPSNFIAVDERCLDVNEPKVFIASSLDFHGEDTSDDLGWTYGYVDASEAHIDYVGFDIANSGPEEVIEEPKKLWLSDLKEFSANEWNEEW